MPESPCIRILEVMKHVKAHVRRVALSLFVMMIVMMPLEVWAQAAPPPSIRNSPKPWMGMIMMILLAIAILSVSLIPSKRSHLD